MSIEIEAQETLSALRFAKEQMLKTCASKELVALFDQLIQEAKIEFDFSDK
jgi:hypothetical protein